WAYGDFLAILVGEEVAQRQQTRVQRLSRRACFPFLKTIDDFNFTYQTTVKLSLLGSALSPDFVTEGRCLVLHGKPGRGKTHLAVAIAYRAIQNGFDALFATAAELIDDLSAAFRAGGLADALVPYVSPDVLVVDEVGYLTTALMPRTCSTTSSTSDIVSGGAWSSPATSPPMPGVPSCTTMTWRRRSSTESSSAGACSGSKGPPSAPSTSALTLRQALRHRQLHRPEFPELGRQNFRNPQAAPWQLVWELKPTSSVSRTTSSVPTTVGRAR
ncbi:MAG TPA: ATP-binding protein, partial [Myxococcales bacterium]|nr:ATP-binding protein [Myxococcales bacterium]